MVPRETSKVCFPLSPDVSRDTRGKTKPTVSLGTIHEVYIVVRINSRFKVLFENEVVLLSEAFNLGHLLWRVNIRCPFLLLFQGPFS